MKTIAVMSPKGGIGKTTTADSVAYILGEERGKRVLVIEGDPQGDTSRTYGAYDPEGIGMSELLERHLSIGGDYSTRELIHNTPYTHIHIIPGNGYLMQTDMNLLQEKEENQVNRLRTALEEVQGDYDFCICDCGRLFDMVVINILLASDLIIAPVKVGGFEVAALAALTEQVEDLKRLSPDYEHIRVKAVMTMRQKNLTTLDAEEWLRNTSGFDMYTTPIRRSIQTEKASMLFKPLPLFSRRGIVTQDYRALVDEIIKDMGV